MKIQRKIKFLIPVSWFFSVKWSWKVGITTLSSIIRKRRNKRSEKTIILFTTVWTTAVPVTLKRQNYKSWKIKENSFRGKDLWREGRVIKSEGKDLIFQTYKTITKMTERRVNWKWPKRNHPSRETLPEIIALPTKKVGLKLELLKMRTDSNLGF